MFKDSVIILQKELRRLFTDRRMIALLVLVPMLVLPLMYTVMAKFEQSRNKQIVSYLGNIYIQDQPAGSNGLYKTFIDQLSTLNIKINTITREQVGMVKRLIQEKEAEVLIVFPENMEEKFLHQEIFDVQVYYNKSSDYSTYFRRHIVDTFEQLKNELVAEYIQEKKLPKAVVQPFTINQSLTPEEINLAKEGSVVGKLLGTLLPFFIILYIFSNAMAVGMDTVAGEKERGTLALLLVNQVDRLSIVVGKLLSVMVAALVGAASSLLGLIIAARYFLSMFGTSPEVMKHYVMYPEQLLQIMIILVPLAMALVSLVMIISTYAKNLKEAQGMIMPIYFVVMILGVSSITAGDDPAQWMRLTPIANSLSAMKAVFMQSAVWQDIGIAALSSFVLTVICIIYMIKLFNDERILFRI